MARTREPLSAGGEALLAALRADLETLPHGAKSARVAAVAATLGRSTHWVYGRLAEAPGPKTRKRRADAGAKGTALTRAEALDIVSVLTTSTRKNSKRLLSVEQAVDILRANGRIEAERVNPDTGEIRRLSVPAIIRAMRAHGFDLQMLSAPSPHTRMATRHPNAVWQLDASLCVLYYLPRQADDNGLRIARHDEFYTNKPANLKRIENDRVWRYVVTDHCSGAVFATYVYGGETGENICNVLIAAMQQRGTQPFHGVPWMLMVDPGSANTGALARNLCDALTIRLQVTKPGNPRAKGSVEKGQDLVERRFESGLRFTHVGDLAELNRLAGLWADDFNARAIHARTGRTRYEVWQTISVDQLRVSPPEALCRELVRAAPVERVVSGALTISFQGREYSVRAVPNSMVEQKVRVTRNAWANDIAQVQTVDAEGNHAWVSVPIVAHDAYGYPLDAPVIGESYKAPPKTPAQRAAEEIERHAWGADGAPDPKRRRVANQRLPFAGELDPYRPFTETRPATTWLPRPGTDHAPAPGVAPLPVAPPPVHAGRRPSAADHEPVVITGVVAAMRLKPLLAEAGVAWTPEHFTALATRFPAGVPEDAIPALVAEWTAPAPSAAPGARPALRVVKG